MKSPLAVSVLRPLAGSHDLPAENRKSWAWSRWDGRGRGSTSRCCCQTECWWRIGIGQALSRVGNPLENQHSKTFLPTSDRILNQYKNFVYIPGKMELQNSVYQVQMCEYYMLDIYCLVRLAIYFTHLFVSFEPFVCPKETNRWHQVCGINENSVKLENSNSMLHLSRR